jgi:chemotaxis family two-component system sensor kinase Cph1
VHRSVHYTAARPLVLFVSYSDGLIERRSETIGEGMARLATAFSARRDEPPATLVSSLLHELRDTEHPDDVCLLVADV